MNLKSSFFKLRNQRDIRRYMSGGAAPVKIIRFIGKSSPYKFALIASAISCKSAGVSPGFQPMLI